jgi:CheY-like chemotaxis protein
MVRGGKALPKKRILMIEDDEEMIALGELILEREGFEVISATTGPEGLTLLGNSPADLILLDIIMDGMDGWTVLETIKADAQLAPIPVIILTARDRAQDQANATAHENLFARYIVKPFVVHDLIQKVKDIISA